MAWVGSFQSHTQALLIQASIETRMSQGFIFQRFLSLSLNSFQAIGLGNLKCHSISELSSNQVGKNGIRVLIASNNFWVSTLSNVVIEMIV